MCREVRAGAIELANRRGFDPLVTGPAGAHAGRSQPLHRPDRPRDPWQPHREIDEAAATAGIE